MSAIVAEVPWHALFPGPFSKPALMSVKELHSALLAKASILVVDVRRTDFESAFIKGAINLPAQSFYQTLEGLLPMLSRYERVVFHCSSSNGRGPRVAGYYGDALEKAGITSSQSVVLVGGIKAWAEAYGDDSNLVCKL